VIEFEYQLSEWLFAAAMLLVGSVQLAVWLLTPTETVALKPQAKTEACR
jgi:hypothetical protein